MSVDRTKYRPDIDGLRAFAVFAVVAYHAGLPGFSGGFIGVDVFFVISGYLITRLLSAEIAESGRVSFLDFYARRVKRLVPALFVVILVTLLLNVFWVPGFVDTKKFAASVRWAVFGFANVFFKRNTGGYFDGSTEEMPLLHLWSLGVEEQFYFFWPLLLTFCQGWLLSKQSEQSQRNRSTLIVLTLLNSISFGAACWAIQHGKASAAFYLMPFRAWELGIGASLACLSASIKNDNGNRQGEASHIAAVCGLGLVWMADLCYSSKTTFPGVTALLPVIGTALLIWAGDRNPKNPISSFLSSRVLVRIGLLSYGWYLWHWPLLVTARLWNMGAVPSAFVRICIVGLSLICAELSLRWLETPIRRAQISLMKSSRVVVSGGLMLGVAFIVFTFKVSNLQDFVLSKRLGSELVQKVNARTRFDGKCFSQVEIGSKDCQVKFSSANERASYLAIWGDSHACSYFAMLEKYGREHGLDLVQYCQGQTPPFVSSSNAHRVLEDIQQKVKEVAPKSVSIVLAARWMAYTGKRMDATGESAFPTLGDEAQSLVEIKKQLIETYLALKAVGVSKILVILPYPEFPYPTLRCLMRGQESCVTPRSVLNQYRGKVVQAIQESAQSFKDVRLIDPVSAVCDSEICPQVIHGVPIVIDTNHPSVTAAQSVGQFYSKDLDWLLL
jgi:peptidoglycan/LPS O-acetylase OafA/YrhL